MKKSHIIVLTISVFLKSKYLFATLGLLLIHTIAVKGESHYCTKNVSTTVFHRPTKECGSLKYLVVSSGHVSSTKEDTKACCPGYHGEACNIVSCSCSDGKICAADGKCICPSDKYRNGKCIFEACNTAIDCFPGTCSVEQPVTCICTSGFTNTNASKKDCEKVRYGPTLSSCRIILNGKSYDRICEGKEDGVTVYARDLDRNTSITLLFDASYTLPADTPRSYGVVRASQIGITDVTISLNTKLVAPTQEFSRVNSFSCSPHPSYQRQVSFKCNISKPFPVLVQEHSISMHVPVGGYRNISDTTMIMKKLSKATTIFTIDIKIDTSPPACMKSQCREIVICPDVTKEEFTVEWSEWDDEGSGIATYEWGIYKLVKNGSVLKQAAEPLISGSWQPGQAYPKLIPDESGMYSAVLNVTDRAGIYRAVRTWVLYNPESEIITPKDLPISLNWGFEESKYEWLSNKDDIGLQYSWKDSFLNLKHAQEYLLPIALDDRYSDVPNKRPREAIPNVRGIVSFQYSFSHAAANVDDNRYTTPNDWIDVYLNESITVKQTRSHMDTLHFWVKAVDIMGNTAKAGLTTQLDITPPSKRSGSQQETTPPPNATVTFIPETNKPIKGIPHFTSSLKLDIQDKESGIGWAYTDLLQGNNVIFKAKAPAISYPSSSSCPGECYCLSRTYQCFPYKAEVLLNNCMFLGVDLDITQLSVKFANQAGIPSNQILMTIPHEVSRNSGYNNYPSPVDIRVNDVFENNATLRFTYVAACYERMELQMFYKTKNDVRNYTKSLSKDTSNPDQLTLEDLQPNTNYDVTLTLIYEGDIENNSSAVISFRTKRGAHLHEGAIAGIVIGCVVLLALVALLIFYRDRWVPRASQFFQDALKKEEFPFPQSVSKMSLPRGAFLNHGYDQSQEEDKAYQDVASVGADPGIRTLSSKQYQLLDELGRGQKAVVKSALLQDTLETQNAAAKMNFPSATEDQKLLLKAKLRFLAKEVPYHLNLVNFIAADMSVPIIFLDECDHGPLSNYLMSMSHFSTYNRQILDTVMNFTRDIASALVHLHSNEIIHRKLGVRNILLASSPTGVLIAKVTGFGPKALGREASANMVPLRWTPPEYFGNKTYSQSYEKSLDIWSYGVTLWEMFSKGEMPYATMTGSKIKTFIRSGKRLARPDTCPQELYDKIIMACWREDRYQRPSAEELLRDLDNFFPGQTYPADEINNSHQNYETNSSHQNYETNNNSNQNYETNNSHQNYETNNNSHQNYETNNSHQNYETNNIPQ